MPKKNNQKQSASQAKNSAASAKQLQRAAQAYRKQIEVERKALRRSKDKELKAVLKNIAGMGIYEPKSPVLTPYRRRRLREVKREYGKFLSGDYFMLPIPKEDRKAVIARAEELKFDHTKFGLIVPRKKHTHARIRKGKNKKGKPEYTIIKTGKTKWGPNRGRIYTDALPLATVDDIEIEKDRIRREAKRLGPLNDDQFFIFIVEEDNTLGVSRLSFKDIEDLLQFLDEGGSASYQINPMTQTQVMRHIHIEKVTTEQKRIKYPPKDRGKPRTITKGRFITKGKFNTRGSK